jgi:hypothetical protein
MPPAPGGGCGIRQNSGFLFFKHPEGFAGEVFAVNFLGVEDVAEFVAAEAIKVSIAGVELGADLGAAVLVSE